MNDFDYLDDCWERWEKLSVKKRTREQQCVVDVCGAITAVEGDGLHNFWFEFGQDGDRIVESFRMAGAGDIAQMFVDSSFCREVIARGVDENKGWRFTPEQEALLSRLERQISDRGPDVREALLRFLPERRG